MTPPGGGVSKELTCEGCNTTFVHTKKKRKVVGLNIVLSVYLNIRKYLKKKDAQTIAEK